LKENELLKKYNKLKKKKIERKEPAIRNTPLKIITLTII